MAHHMSAEHSSFLVVHKPGTSWLTFGLRSHVLHELPEDFHPVCLDASASWCQVRSPLRVFIEPQAPVHIMLFTGCDYMSPIVMKIRRLLADYAFRKWLLGALLNCLYDSLTRVEQAADGGLVRPAGKAAIIDRFTCCRLYGASPELVTADTFKVHQAPLSMPRILSRFRP